MTEATNDIPSNAVRHGNRTRRSGFPARDIRRSLLKDDLVQITPIDHDAAQPEPDHSAHYEDEESDHPFKDRYNAKPYGPGYMERYGAKKSEPHPLDDNTAREAWTYGDPAQVSLRLHNQHNHLQ